MDEDWECKSTMDPTWLQTMQWGWTPYLEEEPQQAELEQLVLGVSSDLAPEEHPNHEGLE